MQSRSFSSTPLAGRELEVPVKNEGNLGHIKRLLPFLKSQWRYCLLAGLLMFLTVGLKLPLPLLTRHVIDHVLPERNFRLLNWIVVGLFLFSIINLLSSFWSRFLLTLVRERVLRRIQLRLFEHIERLNLSFHNDKNTGYLMSRISNDVAGLRGLLADTLLNLILDVLTFCVGTVIVFWFHWKLALISLTMLPLFIYSIHFFSGRIRNKSWEMQERIGQAFGTLAESLMGIRLVKSFCMEKAQAKKLLKKLNASLRTNVEFSVLTSISALLTAFIGGIGPLAVLWYGGREVMSGRLTLGTLVAFSAFLGYMYGPAQRLMNLNSQVQASLASLRRIFELLDLVPENVGATSSRELLNPQGKVRFEGVSFSYDGSRRILENINLDVEVGQRVALVGKSGAGKTTLVNLLLRFYEPQEGRIYLDNVDINELGIYSLRRLIGLVAQDVFLFSGTVKENIRYGKWHASEQEILSAAGLANIHDFIAHLPRGYDTEIGERGVKLSGGERQRLAIARTILKDPKILIMDEATSEVDSETEKLIQDAFARLLENRTAFIIAHRLATVLTADKIVVMDKGQIIGMGTHRELYSSCQLYRHLCDLQFRV